MEVNKKIVFLPRLFGVWRSWLAYLHGVQGVGSSSLLTPTNKRLTINRLKNKFSYIAGICFFISEKSCGRKQFLAVTGKMVMFRINKGFWFKNNRNIKAV